MADCPAYVTAKAAVTGLTRALARELGPERIRVNCMVPGWVMTERQMRLWLTPEGERQIEERQCLPRPAAIRADIARMALFLAADDSRMCTLAELHRRWRLGVTRTVSREEGYFMRLVQYQRCQMAAGGSACVTEDGNHLRPLESAATRL